MCRGLPQEWAANEWWNTIIFTVFPFQPSSSLKKSTKQKPYFSLLFSFYFSCTFTFHFFLSSSVLIQPISLNVVKDFGNSKARLMEEFYVLAFWVRAWALVLFTWVIHEVPVGHPHLSASYQQKTLVYKARERVSFPTKCQMDRAHTLFYRKPLLRSSHGQAIPGDLITIDSPAHLVFILTHSVTWSWPSRRRILHSGSFCTCLSDAFPEMTLRHSLTVMLVSMT